MRLDLRLNSTCRVIECRSSMPISRTFQLCTLIGLISVGESNGARLLPSLIVVPPTVMLSISQPPSLTPPSLT
ncbi:hypothetical protein AB0H57_20065 [Micromonospora sp. NPDC050686]|uniref:hypothetical protein n=1 Tax=Micromonospora sp. NPDC050686 TaxID=3154631 RepID=UPI0033F2F756